MKIRYELLIVVALMLLVTSAYVMATNSPSCDPNKYTLDMTLGAFVNCNGDPVPDVSAFILQNQGTPEYVQKDGLRATSEIGLNDKESVNITVYGTSTETYIVKNKGGDLSIKVKN